jgi:O-antigen ligase
MNGVSFFLPIIIGVICLISGLISGSRTFLLIFLFQLALAIFLIIRNSHLKFRILSVTVGIFFLSATIFGGNYEYYLSQISSIFDIENSYSTMTRLGIAYAAFNMFIDNWISGVGIGQFTYHFAKYVPDWALFSPEVQAYISGDIEHRINAFNLFLRVGSEMGFIAFFSFVYFIFKLLKSALFLIENNKNEKLWSIGILISSIGGLSYWMQQDLFSYQPGIFSIALILYLTENTNTENHG